MTEFDTETAVTALGDGVWQAHVSREWNIASNPNGGYLLAIALRSIQALDAHQDPLTVTAHFLRPGTANAPAELRTELIRAGRTITTARVSLSQGGKQRMEVIAGFGDLDAVSSNDHALTIEMPDIPPPDECTVRSGLEQGVDLPILQRLETRIHPDQARAGDVGRAEVSGWIRFGDGRPPDALAAVLFADAFPPSLFGLLGYVGWVPTVELTVHVRRRPTPGWLLGRFTTNDLQNGRLIEDGALWDETGALVAQCRQIGLVLS